MALNLHPADLSDIEKIATATHFTVHLRSGPHDKITKRAKTLAAAIRAADKLGNTPGGRKPMIYAVTPDKMTVHVPAAMIAQARKEAATAPRRAASKDSGARPKGRRAEIAENAAKGILPLVPDFSAETHRRFRGKLAEIVALVEAGDVAALKAIEIKPYSSSPKALDRYRNLAVSALEAKERPSKKADTSFERASISD
ncbi:hypothetical protein EET67_23915 [Pseudaminobacter arsenicus]|uniref:Uncharacterized protein n=1 Tax=Borborobacter arsenicus TaxID=1851146 RepID=A0A432UZH1_9HYPH|nr:hypothetical protein [Pseudaminobacter arsenicus]RUM95326.1 hypothetical protein EET67_23915 [Pseudaminobacter arsenicus]